MPTPGEEMIRKIITAQTAPRIADHQLYLACAAPDPFPVARSNLLYLFDEYGDQYLDFAADGAPLGHCDPRTMATLHEHLNHYLAPGRVDEMVLRYPVEYAKALSESFPSSETDRPQQVFFCASESEAMLVAQAMTREDPSRGERFIDISMVDAQGEVITTDEVDRLVQRACDDGRKLICDERHTGYGRTGTMWAQQQWGLYPDITVLGSPGGGGLPFGAVVAPPEAFEKARLTPSRQDGNPYVCAAGLMVLSQINEGVLEHATDAGHTLEDALNEVIEQFPGYVVATRGLGLIRTLDFQSTTMAEQFRPDARRHGLNLPLPVGSSFVLTPPLIISENEVRRGVDMIASALLEWHEKGVG